MATTITREALQQKLDQKEPFHLVEVLSEEEFRRLHIPGAVHIQFNRIGTEATRRFHKTDEIILYCMDPHCRASPIAAEKLENLGFTNIAIYSGGKQDWAEGGLPVQGEEAGA